jgi:hypothetical protein
LDMPLEQLEQMTDVEVRLWFTALTAAGKAAWANSGQRGICSPIAQTETCSSMCVQVALHNAKTEEVHCVCCHQSWARPQVETSATASAVRLQVLHCSSELVTQVGRFQLRLHRDMVVADVLRLLRERAGSAWEGKPLRLLRLQDSEIYKVRGCKKAVLLQEWPARNHQGRAMAAQMTSANGCTAG